MTPNAPNGKFPPRVFLSRTLSGYRIMGDENEYLSLEECEALMKEARAEARFNAYTGAAVFIAGELNNGRSINNETVKKLYDIAKQARGEE